MSPPFGWILRRFRAAVNMEPEDLQSWLETAPSKAVGWPKDRAPGVESVDHASGRRVLQILGTPEAALSEDDYRHICKVAGYVARHLKHTAAAGCHQYALAVQLDELGARSGEVRGAAATTSLAASATRRNWCSSAT